MSNDLGPSSETTEPNDPELIARARAGDERAQEMLYSRHYAAAMGVARRHSNSSYEIEDLVSEGFEKVFAVLRTDRGPEAFFRAYLCTTVSRLAFAYNNQEKRQSLTDDFTTFDTGDEHSDPVMNRFESGVVANAFRALPERWQAVLWYMEIDGLKPAEAAPLLGLSANGVSALAVRAREGLRQAYLQGHVMESAVSGDCQGIARQLGAYARGGLSARNEAKVDEHLGECNKCTAILLQVNDVGASMRGIIAPLFLGGITVLGIPAAITAASTTGSGVLATGTTAAGGTGAGAVAGGVGGTTIIGGIGAFIGANAMAVAVTGVAVAAVLAGVSLGIADLGRKDGMKAGAGEITRSVPTGPAPGGVGETSAVPDIHQSQLQTIEQEKPVALDSDGLPSPNVGLRDALLIDASAMEFVPVENTLAPLKSAETDESATEPTESQKPLADSTPPPETPPPETPTSIAPETEATDPVQRPLPPADISETPAETAPVVPTESTSAVPSESVPVVPTESTSAVPSESVPVVPTESTSATPTETDPPVLSTEMIRLGSWDGRQFVIVKNGTGDRFDGVRVELERISAADQSDWTAKSLLGRCTSVGSEPNKRSFECTTWFMDELFFELSVPSLPTSGSTVLRVTLIDRSGNTVSKDLPIN